MLATIAHHAWNWFDIISSLLTLGVVLGTLAMAWSTRKLAAQATADSEKTARLAKAAEDQREIAQRSEFAARQPVLIPIEPGEYEEPIIPRVTAAPDIWWGNPLSSYWFLNDDQTVSVRLMMRNVGNGVASMAADRDAPEIFATLGRGFHSLASPSSRTIAPDEIFHVSFKGKSLTGDTISAASWPSGHTPAVILTLVYTDLTETMEMKCQVWYEDAGAHELRAFKTLHLAPSHVTAPSPVQFFNLRPPNSPKGV